MLSSVAAALPRIYNQSSISNKPVIQHPLHFTVGNKQNILLPSDTYIAAFIPFSFGLNGCSYSEASSFFHWFCFHPLALLALDSLTVYIPQIKGNTRLLPSLQPLNQELQFSPRATCLPVSFASAHRHYWPWVSLRDSPDERNHTIFFPHFSSSI